LEKKSLKNRLSLLFAAVFEYLEERVLLQDDSSVLSRPIEFLMQAVDVCFQFVMHSNAEAGKMEVCIVHGELLHDVHV
jgi:hypothetical protein